MTHASISYNGADRDTIYHKDGAPLRLTGNLMYADVDAPSGLEIGLEGRDGPWQAVQPGGGVRLSRGTNDNSKMRLRLRGAALEAGTAPWASLATELAYSCAQTIDGAGEGLLLGRRIANRDFRMYNEPPPAPGRTDLGCGVSFGLDKLYTNKAVLLSEFFSPRQLAAAKHVVLDWSYSGTVETVVAFSVLPSWSVDLKRGPSGHSRYPAGKRPRIGGSLDALFGSIMPIRARMVLPGPFTPWDFLAVIGTTSVVHNTWDRLHVSLSDREEKEWASFKVIPTDAGGSTVFSSVATQDLALTQFRGHSPIIKCTPQSHITLTSGAWTWMSTGEDYPYSLGKHQVVYQTSEQITFHQQSEFPVEEDGCVAIQAGVSDPKAITFFGAQIDYGFAR